jgi:branched-chain amino acid aminotransferase
LGVQSVERPIARSELYYCDEMFLCGTGVQIAPITSVDHRIVGDGEMGTISRGLQTLYFDAVRGLLPNYRHWLTPTYAALRVPASSGAAD